MEVPGPPGWWGWHGGAVRSAFQVAFGCSQLRPFVSSLSIWLLYFPCAWTHTMGLSRPGRVGLTDDIVGPISLSPRFHGLPPTSVKKATSEKS